MGKANLDSSLLRGVARNGKGKLGSFAFFTCKINSTPVVLDDFFGEEQPDAKAGVGLFLFALDAVEAAKDLGMVFLFDTNTVIAYAHGYMRVLVLLYSNF